MIGYFGDVVFICSDSFMLTPSNWSRESTARWQDYNLILKKPVSSFGGPGLEKISFNILLDAALGVNPESQLQFLRDVRDSGAVNPLVIGDQVITDNYWRLDSIKESDAFFTNDAKLYRITAQIQLTEYPTTDSVDPDANILQKVFDNWL